MSKKELTYLIKEKSKDLGFNLVGVTTPHKIENNFLDNWIDNGYHATMYWMENRSLERSNVLKYYPNAKSIISLGITSEMSSTILFPFELNLFDTYLSFIMPDSTLQSKNSLGWTMFLLSIRNKIAQAQNK